LFRIRHDFIAYSTDLSYILGLSDDVSISMPIVSVLEIIGMIVTILVSIIVFIVIMIGLFGVYVISNFMILSVNTRLFIFGMWRMFGLRRLHIVVFIIGGLLLLFFYKKQNKKQINK
jgi:ABC-type antimicrobial peptide transport system permease subunit